MGLGFGVVRGPGWVGLGFGVGFRAGEAGAGPRVVRYRAFGPPIGFIGGPTAGSTSEAAATKRRLDAVF